jgi:serine-type D-Ala-D-Ala carboxypeptidase (penicillin-binding protein 5/6)
MKQRGIAILLGLFILGFVLESGALSLDNENLPFTVRGKAAILGDINSGKILFEQNADESRQTASLTKVMTLYLAYEALANGRLTLESKLPVSEKAWRMGGSKTFVHVGDQIETEHLIRGIAIQGGNDAALVIAEHLGGSDSGFADMMNAKAVELGMHSTNFMNSTGLTIQGQHSTARDMFTLARAIVLDFPQYGHFVQQKEYTFQKIRQYNHNRLLWRDPSITGLKTGYTSVAGYCLIATNKKDGQHLASVVLGAKIKKNSAEDALRLLRYGNRKFKTMNLFDTDAKVRSFPVWKGDKDEIQGVVRKSVMVTVPRNTEDSLEVDISYNEPLIAPINKDQKIGMLVVKLKDEEVLRLPIVAGHAVAEGGVWHIMLDTVRLKLGW